MRTLQLNEVKSIAGGNNYHISVGYSIEHLKTMEQDVAHEAAIDAVVIGTLAGAVLAYTAVLPVSTVVTGAVACGALAYNYSYKNNELWPWSV